MDRMKTPAPEAEAPSFGLMLAVGVVSALVTGAVVAIASLSPGLGFIVGAVVGLLSMAFASERLSLLPFRRKPRH